MNYDEERRLLKDTLHTFLGTSRFEGVGPRQDEIQALMNIIETMIGRHELGLREAIEWYLDSCGVQICGGAVVSVMMKTKVNDLDFYLMDPSFSGHLKVLLNFMLEDEPFYTANAVTYSRKGTGRTRYSVQVIYRFVGHPQEIFKNFDFTVTQAAYSFMGDEFHFGERFWPDIAARRLIYQGDSKYPICALYRTKKYERKGFRTPGSTLMHIGLCIVQLDIKTYKELKEQLHGIDTQFLGPLLNEKDDAAPVDVGAFLKEALDAIYGETEDMDD
jgi:hypothetical protein